MPPDPLAVTLTVVDILESLQIPYLITGSLASALHGLARSTMDVDLVADLRMEHAEPLVRELSEAFYVDLHAVREAIRRRSSFNAIHLESAFKADVFVSKDRPFDRLQLERRALYEVSPQPAAAAYFATPEDLILSKLEWYRQGHESSLRQWDDVLGVLKVQGEALDLSHLHRWAAELRVADLLERALREAAT